MKQGSGHQYQNFLTKPLSMELIRKVEPDVAIFSGDDHDYCFYTHYQGPNTYGEVGSFITIDGVLVGFSMRDDCLFTYTAAPSM